MVKVLDSSREDVVKEIREGNVTICVVGLGYVGLPLAVLFAEEGARVIGCDCNEKYVKGINGGETRVVEHDVSILSREGAVRLEISCPNCGVPLFKLGDETFCPCCGKLAHATNFGARLEDEVAMAHEKVIKSRRSLKDLLRKTLENGRFYATTDTSNAVQRSDVILIAVGTPVDKRSIPDYGDLKSACHAVGQSLKKGSLVILKSTVSPGTTENLVKPILEGESGLKAGVDFGLAFMPESITEGHALYEFRTLPRIVGGITRRCAQAAATVFSVFPVTVHIYENPSIVEAAKLFMNIYRDTNVALVNELAMICEKLGINVIQAISAANVDPKTRLLTPGLVGGYCLPKDLYLLTRPAEKEGYRPRLITMARKLNKAMPGHVLRMVDEAFKEMNLPMRGARIAVLGLGFKANSGDLRNTPAKPIIKGLLRRGAYIIAQDPFARSDEVSQNFSDFDFTRSVDEAARGAKCIVIVTDHLEYRGLTASYLRGLMSAPCAIVDARHIIDPKDVALSGTTFRGLGKPHVSTKM